MSFEIGNVYDTLGHDQQIIRDNIASKMEEMERLRLEKQIREEARRKQEKTQIYYADEIQKLRGPYYQRIAEPSKEQPRVEHQTINECSELHIFILFVLFVVFIVNIFQAYSNMKMLWYLEQQQVKKITV
jgi:hypothetical protein